MGSGRYLPLSLKTFRPSGTTGKAPAGKVKSVGLLGYKGTLSFSQDETGLSVWMPGDKVGEYAFVLKITGLKLK